MLDPTLARRIRLIGFDVDGVLTDNGIYVGEVGGEPVEYKRFDIQDGLGLRLLQLVGMECFLLSGRFSRATELRARELGITAVYQDAGARKLPILETVAQESGVALADIAFVGDDLADLPVLSRVGLPIAVANAVPEVKALAAITTHATGGAGAVREVIETFLRARGEWDLAVERYVARVESAPAPVAEGT